MRRPIATAIAAAVAAIIGFSLVGAASAAPSGWKVGSPHIGTHSVQMGADGGAATESDMHHGPGWDTGVRPSDGLRMWILGHRTTKGAPFGKIDRHKLGSSIYLRGPGGGKYRYRVVRSLSIPAYKLVRSADRTPQGWLYMSACDPPGSAAYRWTVLAMPQKVWRARQLAKQRAKRGNSKQLPR